MNLLKPAQNKAIQSNLTELKILAAIPAPGTT